MKKMSIRNAIVVSFTTITVLIFLLDVIVGVTLKRSGMMEMAYFMFTVAAVCIVICLWSEYIIIRKVVKPLKEIDKGIDLIKVGHVDVTVKKFYDDEMGQVVDALNDMVKSIKSQAVTAYEISKGDLTVDIKPRSEADVLSLAFKELTDKNSDVLSAIKESTMQVTAGAGQVADASQALAQGSTEQASAIEQVTASMDEIANMTKGNAEEATKADNIVHELKEKATRGNSHMEEMMVAMDEINESSDKISKVIKVIDDIAFQTNILALNATVEAARAGVHGKGFAVVAEEVRNLAEKSASAAKETSDMIQDSIERVKHGTQLASNTSDELSEIVTSIDDIVKLIDAIAKASGNQATAVTQINQAINQVSQVVQTNSATSEQCASASEELANQAESLRNMLAKFKLKENGRYVSTPVTTSRSTSYSSYSSNDNEKIISLDGGFGKY